MNTSNIWRKLRNKKYRDAFVASQLKRGMPFQISAMRKKLDWSQEDLAKASGVTQGVISRAENPNYGNLTFNTVLHIAAGFDVAFVGWFVPFSKLTEWYENLSEESVQVATFEEEDKESEEQKEQVAAEISQGMHISGSALTEFLKTETQRQTSAAEQVDKSLTPRIPEKLPIFQAIVSDLTPPSRGTASNALRGDYSQAA